MDSYEFEVSMVYIVSSQASKVYSETLSQKEVSFLWHLLGSQSRLDKDVCLLPSHGLLETH